MKTQASFTLSLNLTLASYLCLRESLTDWRVCSFHVSRMRLTLTARLTSAPSWWTASRLGSWSTPHWCKGGHQRRATSSSPSIMATHTYCATIIYWIQGLTYTARNRSAILWYKGIMASTWKITIKTESSLEDLFSRISTYSSITIICNSISVMDQSTPMELSRLMGTKTNSLREGPTSFSWYASSFWYCLQSWYSSTWGTKGGKGNLLKSTEKLHR